MPADPRRTVMSGAMINPHAVLTLSQFNYIPRTVSKGDSGSCNLCSKNIARNEEVVSLHPCNHKFHVECAFDWFTQKSTHCSECGQDMIKALGLPEPTFFANPETEAAGSVAYPMPNPNYHIANKNDGSYPAAPNQAHVSDKHSPFLQ
ncbi:hypothetical protein LPJ64_002812 [Coemansia asiatica]|uniref:RING-type domain-containing protein n=1 Tax=Coemansia asiatica TaxID=1052880 RepID=A0A9W8CKN4_9FUNG|nr:hypothetical protein LPJ64_002812 [Coemansia asiatica]